MRHNILVFSLLLMLSFLSCTKLDESFRGELEATDAGTVTAAQILTSAYTALNNPLQSAGQFWAAQQHTTDESLAPTRGSDWFDGGKWAVLHTHQWDDNNEEIRNAFQNLLQAQFTASTVLQNNPTPQQAAEARFIRAFTVLAVADGWDQVPYREDLTDFRVPPRTLKGAESADFIISEMEAVINNLPDGGPAYVANKNAARFLMMKALLNKGVFANREAPTFNAADMTKVITLADQIISSNQYSLANNYFDNFAPTNDALSTENIFTLKNDAGIDRGDNVRGRWMSELHYNQKPSGWNGFATLSEFYDKFEASDSRRGVRYPGQKNFSGSPSGNTVGFLIGQQYNETGAPIMARNPATLPLVFTREVKQRESGTNLEVTGIRVLKYPIDYSLGTGDGFAGNDYVVFRYPDVLLMKAEAILRGGTPSAVAPVTPLALVNTIRIKRGATPLTSVDLNTLLDERGLELYWEGWRRQDLIRFGKFLQAWQEKPASDGPRRLLFPIPSNQLAVNPNLVQNPGYNQ